MKPVRILIVDDEPDIRRSLSGVLEDEGYAARAVESGEACLDELGRQPFELVLLGVWLPGMDGMETLTRIQETPLPERPVVVMISGHGNIETAVKATKLGAFDFLEKPLTIQKISVVAKNALEHRRLQIENSRLREDTESRYRIIGESVPMKALRHELALMAGTDRKSLVSSKAVGYHTPVATLRIENAGILYLRRSTAARLPVLPQMRQAAARRHGAGARTGTGE